MHVSSVGQYNALLSLQPLSVADTHLPVVKLVTVYPLHDDSQSVTHWLELLHSTFENHCEHDSSVAATHVHDSLSTACKPGHSVLQSSTQRLSSTGQYNRPLSRLHVLALGCTHMWFVLSLWDDTVAAHKAVVASIVLPHLTHRDGCDHIAGQ